MSILIGTIRETDAEGYYKYSGVYSFCFYSIFFGVISQIQAVPVYFDDLIMFNREKSVKIYKWFIGNI